MSAVLGIFVAPLVVPGANLQTMFTTMTLSFVVIGTALYMFTAFSTKENVKREVTNVTMKQSFATLKGNKPLLLLCLSSFLFLTGFLAMSTVQLYYLRDVLGAIELYPVLSIAQLVLTFGLAGFVPWIVRTFGKKRAYMGAAGIMVLGGVIVFATPPTLVPVAFGGLIVSYFGIMLVSMLVWALEADTVEYGEWNTGIRTEGITYALFSFTRKTGQAVGGALAAYGLAWGGYAAGATVQTEQAMWGIRAATGLVPAVAAVLAIIVMFAYPLTDRRHAEIVDEIAARRLEAGENTPIVPSLSTAAFTAHRVTGTAPPARANGPKNTATSPQKSTPQKKEDPS